MLIFSLIQSLTNDKPGSEIVGVPASDIKETINFFFIRLITLISSFFFH